MATNMLTTTAEGLLAMTLIKGKETILVKRYAFTGEVDEFGNDVKTKTFIAVPNSKWAEGSTANGTPVDTLETKTTATIYFPSGTVIEPEDEFFRGTSTTKSWVMNGLPVVWEVPPGFPIQPDTIVEVMRRDG